MAYNPDTGEWEDEQLEFMEEPYYEAPPPQIDAGGHEEPQLGQIRQPEQPPAAAPSQQNPEDFLKDLGSRYNVSVESSDLGKIREKNPEDVEKFMKDLEAQYARRAEPTGHRGVDSQTLPNTPSGLSPRGADQWLSGMGLAPKKAAPAPAWSLPNLQTLGQTWAGPQSFGVFDGDLNQDLGQDPFSQLISGGYAGFLGGGQRGASTVSDDTESDGLGENLDFTIQGLLDRGGQIEDDPGRRARRMEAARQPIDAFRSAQLDSARANLANRGLLSVPGSPSGSESGAYRRIEEGVAPHYATAAQNLAETQSAADDERFLRAMGIGAERSRITAASADAEAKNTLQALSQMNERQGTLAQIALGTLDRNMAWNRFLAEFGLERDKVMYAIQSGRIDQMMPILQMFQFWANMSRGGYV